MKRRQKILRIWAISLAFLIFSTSVGSTMSMHFCQGQLQHVSLFVKAKSCHQKTTSSHCHHQPEKPPCHQVKKVCHQSMEKKNCCENKTVLLQLDPETNAPASISFDVGLVQFIVAFSHFLPFDRLDYTHITPDYQNYKPPLLDRDISVLVQSFLL